MRFAFALVVTLAAVDASADPPPEYPAVPVTVVESFRAPSSIGEYQQRQRMLRIALKNTGSAEESIRIGAELQALEQWGSENVTREDTGLFVAGIIAASLGGSAVVAGGTVMLVGATKSLCRSCPAEDGYYMVGGIMMIAGVIVGIVGIQIAVHNGEHVLVPKNVTLELGPTGAALAGRF